MRADQAGCGPVEDYKEGVWAEEIGAGRVYLLLHSSSLFPEAGSY